MKKTLLLIPAAALLTCCSTFKSNKRAKTTTSTTTYQGRDFPGNFKTLNDTSTDTIIISGTQYIPLEGRSETGTPAGLEGAWELFSINGSLVPGKSNLHVQPIPKIPEGTEVRHDSITSTRIVKGVTHTTTTVLIDKQGTRGNNITPPQGSNYHIPAKPGISFFGANETFSGFTGCNKFSGRYRVAGKDTISLQSAAASTKMVCLGDYDEQEFLNTLKRVNSFKSINGQLELLEGKKVLLVFSKKQQ